MLVKTSTATTNVTKKYLRHNHYTLWILNLQVLVTIVAKQEEESLW
jgi:hypothetical protein